MEKYFQCVTPKVMYDMNLESLASHSAQYFTPKPSPQKCCEIMSPKIISTVNPIVSMKNWGKWSCTL